MREDVVAAIPAHYVLALPAGDAFRRSVPINDLPLLVGYVRPVGQRIKDASGSQGFEVKFANHNRTAAVKLRRLQPEFIIFGVSIVLTISN
jgi:hypothetical protein